MFKSKRSKRKYLAAPKCDWCSQNNQYFIITASGHTFCREQSPGFLPVKDCHTAYLNHPSKKTNQL